MAKNKLQLLPENQFNTFRELAIDISNNSNHSIETVLSAMEFDLDFSDVTDVICRWSLIAHETKNKTTPPK